MIGVDEVGRGSWAGPLLVCAVRPKVPLTGMVDSKKLSPARRKTLSAYILQNADVGFGWVGNEVVDDVGLSAALRIATQNAITEIAASTHETIIIDGMVNFLPKRYNVTTAVKADTIYAAVSAASIVAKVARDDFMCQQAELYPKYGFNRHAGYGTIAHRAALASYGLTPLHRKSFLPVRNML